MRKRMTAIVLSLSVMLSGLYIYDDTHSISEAKKTYSISKGEDADYISLDVDIETIPDGIPTPMSAVTTDKATPTETPEASTIEPVYTYAPTIEPTYTEAPTTEPSPTVDPQDELRIKAFLKSKVKKPTIKKTLEKKVKLTWKKLSNATSYEIYRSQSKSSGYKKIATTKKLYYKDKKAKKRKTYYYRIKGLMKYKGTTYEAKLSKKKSTYVRPKKPNSVIMGECFVVGFSYVKNLFPSNIHLVGKIGLNSYSMLHSNYFNYNGRTVTAAEKVATYKPDRVYVLIGANEVKTWNPYSTTSHFYQFFQLLKRINKHVEMVVVAVPPFGYHSRLNIPTVSKRNYYNKVYKEFTEKYKNVYYCPATYVLDDGTNHLAKKYNAGDGCHWTNAGSIAVAGKIKEWSKKQLGSY